MTGLPVLIVGAFADKLLQQVVADLALPLRRPDACLVDRLADHFSRWAIVLALGRRFKPWALATHERRHNAWPSRAIAGWVVVSKANSQPGIALQVELEIGRGAEDESLDEGHRAFLLASFLAPQEGAELFGLQVGGDERVIDGRELAIGFPGPRSGVSKEAAGAALDLDEEQSLWREGQQIDFVDAAVFGDELEVRPGAIGLVGGETQADEVQGIPFPGILA